MPRLKTISIAALNIKIHPHSPEMYIDLLKKTTALRRTGKIRGDDWGMILSMRDDMKWKGERILYGSVWRFLNIDPDAAWLDIRNLKLLEPRGKEKTPIIPPNLKPHAKAIFFIFIPSKHRLFFDRKHISPRGMQNLLYDLFAAEPVHQKFGDVDISVETTSELIEKILQIHVLRRLEIYLTIPNSDDLSEEEDRVMQRLTDQNIRNFQEKLSTTDKDGIRPDRGTQTLMGLALSNGRVYATGRDENQKKVEQSTEKHSLIGRAAFSTSTESHFDAILKAAVSMLPRMH